MKRYTSIFAVLLVAVVAFGPSAAHAEWNWLEKSRELKAKLMVTVQKNWSKVKVWMGKAPSQAPQSARVPASEQPAVAPAQAVPPQSVVTVVDDPEQARMPHVEPPLAAADPEVKAKVEQLAPVESAKGTTPSQLNQMKAQTQAKKSFVVVDQGRKAAPQLKRDKAGVVRSDLPAGAKAEMKTSVVSRMDIGQEPKLSADQLSLDKVQFGLVNKQTFKKLDSPAVIAPQTTTAQIQKVVGKGVVAAGGTKKLKETEALQNKMVNLAKVQNMKFRIRTLQDIQEKPFKALSQADLHVLAVLVLVERGDQCHVAAGLLHDLRNEKELEAEVNYYLAVCSLKMGLSAQYAAALQKVIATEDAEFLPKVLEQLSVDVGYDQEVKVGLALQKIQNRKLIPQSARAKVDYLIAKANVRSGNFQTALTAAQAVPEKFEKYPEAQYILAVSQYATGQAKAALSTQEKLLEYLESSGGHTDLKVLAQLNLGRIAFQDKQFEKAKEYFLKIDKNHPLWIEALMEQGWAQLQSGDIGGAIGNMYSVQSPFFRGVYLPESYVIRSIGYLSLCQYGDAYKAISMLEHNYRPWMAQLDRYAQDKKDLYDTVRKYLKSPSSTDVDGLPYQVIREVARQRDFLNQQQVLNALEDEMAQYKFLENMLVKDKATITQKVSQLNNRMMELQKHYAESKNRKEPRDVQDRWVSLIKGVKEDLDFYRFRLDIQMDSRKAFGDMREKNLAALTETKSKMRAKANQILTAHLNGARKELAQIMDNNELLRYEVFAGSGENIRYQAAGGDVGRVPASAKPTSKNLQWEFDGEYWADEIGSYRSTLANNCPDSRRGATPKVAGGE